VERYRGISDFGRVAQGLRLSCAASNNPNNFLEGENYGKRKKLEAATGEQ
jgi:hypothetical protein